MIGRRSSPLEIVGILAILGLVLALVGGGGAFVLMRSSDSFGKLQPFPVERYLEGGGFLGEGEYRLEGRVDNLIVRSRASDFLLASIQPDGSARRLPVLIPQGGGRKPVRREQQLVLKVVLGDAREIVCVKYASR